MPRTMRTGRDPFYGLRTEHDQSGVLRAEHVPAFVTGLLLAILAAGCQQWEKVVDSFNGSKAGNPVMGDPPPRYRPADEPVRTGSAALAHSRREPEADVLPVSLGAGPLPNDVLFGSRTVAVVNGTPVLASEVLERYAANLAEAQAKVPPEDFDKLRLQIIRRDLNHHIERKLLAQALRATIPPDRIEMLNGFIDKLFEEEIERLKSELGAATRVELDEALRKENTTLANLKDNFVTQRMAMEFLASKSQVDVSVGRRELLDYYEAHKQADYFEPGRVKWQQIVIEHDEHGGKQGAYRELMQVIEELKQGAEFGDVARRRSDGPRAEQGGEWDWTQKGSLADTEIEQALFSIPEGRVSRYFEGEDSVRIVKVTARIPDRHKPFEEVQQEIKQKLEREARREAAKKVIDELQQNAVVATIFDGEASSSRKQ